MINKVMLTGNLTRDPEVKATTTGTVIMNITLAVNDRRKQGDEWADYVHYIDCVMFGDRAEKLARFITKGSKVSIVGKLDQQRWEKDGQKRSRIQVVIDEVEFMSKAPTAPTTTPATTDVYDEDMPF